MASHDSEPRKIFEAPTRGPSRSHISGIKMFFYCSIKQLQIVIKHIQRSHQLITEITVVH